MNRIWLTLMLFSGLYAIVSGRSGECCEAILESGSEAVKLMLTLLGAMTLWSGLLEILTEAGDVAKLGRLFRRLAAPAFPGVRDEGCWQAMSANISANVLGLGNAATPAGIRAAQLLAEKGDSGLQALAMLLVMNSTGIQAIPTTVITLRQAAGAANAADVWLPTLLASCASMAAGMGVMMLRRRAAKWKA